MPMPIGYVFVTLTGISYAASRGNQQQMESGAVLCNGGQFQCEVDVEALKAMALGKAENVRPSIMKYVLPAESGAAAATKDLFLAGRRLSREPSVRERAPVRGDGHILSGSEVGLEAPSFG